MYTIVVKMILKVCMFRPNANMIHVVSNTPSIKQLGQQSTPR